MRRLKSRLTRFFSIRFGSSIMADETNSSQRSAKYEERTKPRAFRFRLVEDIYLVKGKKALAFIQ